MKIKTKKRTFLSLVLVAATVALLCFAASSNGAESENTASHLSAMTPQAEIHAEISSRALLAMPDLAGDAEAPSGITAPSETLSDTTAPSEALLDTAAPSEGSELTVGIAPISPEDAEKAASTPENAEKAASTPEEGGAQQNSAPTSADTKITAERGNIFEEIYDYIISYLGDIFSLLAFLIGLATALLYKRGLVPGISKVGAAIKASVDNAREKSERLAADTAVAHGIENEKLDNLGEKLTALSSEIELMKSQLDLTGALEERARIQGVLLMEVDLLYAVFTASSLPNYMKEELFKRVKEMKDALLKNEQAA